MNNKGFFLTDLVIVLAIAIVIVRRVIICLNR